MATDLFKTLDTISAFHNYNSWIYNNIRRYLKGAVLDVGSGIGDIAKYYTENASISKVILTDDSHEMLSYLIKKFNDRPSYEIVQLNIVQKDAASLGNLSVDTITCINVLEHIEDDVSALRNISSFLKPEGVFILVVPACPGIYGTLDSMLGHYRRYNKPAAVRVLSQAGFRVNNIFYMNMAGIITWFIAGRVLKQNKFDPQKGKVLDQVVPFLKSMEQMIKPCIGQSLICICTKSGQI